MATEKIKDDQENSVNPLTRWQLWVSTALGMFCGGWIGAMTGNPIVAVVGVLVVGALAFFSSKRNGGNFPSWLVRTKKK